MYKHKPAFCRAAIALIRTFPARHNRMFLL